MHTSSNAINFTVCGAKIVLTKNDLLVNAENKSSKQETRVSGPGNRSNPKSLIGEPPKNLDLETGTTTVTPLPTKTNAAAMPTAMYIHTQRISPYITAPLHFLVAILLLLLLYKPVQATTVSIILSAPCLWLLPVLFDIFSTDGFSNLTMRSLVGFIYIVLFPIWVNYIVYRELHVLIALLSIMVATAGVIFFTPQMHNNLLATMLLFLGSTVLLPLPILLPGSAIATSICCTCLLSIVLMYSAASVFLKGKK